MMQPKLGMLRRERGGNQDEGDRSEKRSRKALSKQVFGIDASTESPVNRDSVLNTGKQEPRQFVHTFAFHKAGSSSSVLLGLIPLRYHCIKKY